MATLDTNLLMQLVRAKRACLEQLCDMGRRQLELVDAGQITALLDLLTLKQRPLAELQGIERALAPFRRQEPQQRRWATPDQRTRCADELRKCERLLEEILAQEKRSESLLVQRRDAAAVQLQGVHLAREARGAYLSGPSATISQINLLSER